MVILGNQTNCKEPRQMANRFLICLGTKLFFLFKFARHFEKNLVVRTSSDYKILNYEEFDSKVRYMCCCRIGKPNILQRAKANGKTFLICIGTGSFSNFSSDFEKSLVFQSATTDILHTLDQSSGPSWVFPIFRWMVRGGFTEIN